MTAALVLRADLSLPLHAEAVLHLLNMYRSDPMGAGLPLSAEVQARLIPGLVKAQAQVFLAQVGDQFVGLLIAFAGFSTFAAQPLWNIHDVAVDPAYRGQGIGRALLAAAEAAATASGCCKLTLEVRTDNPNAQHLYRAFGFQPGQPENLFWTKRLLA